VQFADQYVPWKITSCSENFVFQALKSEKAGVCQELPGWTGRSHYKHNED